jgi:hypothetical protein
LEGSNPTPCTIFVQDLRGFKLIPLSFVGSLRSLYDETLKRLIEKSLLDILVWVLLSEIDNKIEATKKALRSISYTVKEVSAQEFYDYVTGEIFSEDTTTLDDVLGNEYLMAHELVEINELKQMGRTIDKRVIVDSPKTVIYDAHLTAMETELDYALYKRDHFWVKIRLRQHKGSLLDDDPNLPDEMRPRAEKLFEEFRKAIQNRKKTG